MSDLNNSTSPMYLDYKMKIEKAVNTKYNSVFLTFWRALSLQIDKVFYNSSALKGDYLRSQAIRFYKGGNIPLGLFENEKPTLAPPTTVRPTCDLMSFDVPEHITKSTETNGTLIDPGVKVEYSCGQVDGADKVHSWLAYV